MEAPSAPLTTPRAVPGKRLGRVIPGRVGPVARTSPYLTLYAALSSLTALFMLRPRRAHRWPPGHTRSAYLLGAD